MEYSTEEAQLRERLISQIENSMESLKDLLEEPEPKTLRVVNGEG
jgi:hypothetical protein